MKNRFPEGKGYLKVAKKILMVAFVSLIFTANLYAGETLTAQQKEAKEWYIKAQIFSDDSPTLAIACYTKSIELETKNPGYYFWRGFTYNKIGEDQKAIDDFTTVIKLNPQSPQAIAAYNNRGLIYMSHNFFTIACDDFYQAGLLFLRQGDRTEVLKCIDLMKKADPSSPLIKKLMDKIYEEK